MYAFVIYCYANIKNITLFFTVYAIPQLPAYFNGNSSYLEYRQLLDNSHSHDIYIQFRSEKKDGMLLYAQGPSGVKDFLLIAVTDRRVVVR